MKFVEQFEPYDDMGMHGVRLPAFEIEKKYYDRLGVSSDISNPQFLKELCFKGMATRKLLDVKNNKEYVERGKFELQILEELGFVDYLLLIWDIINFCHEGKIPVGPGRGSAAGSLVLYLIGVTNIDPIENNLFFERFVSKPRAKSTIVDGITYFDGGLLPDVDSDICYYRRREVLDYISKKFAGRTAKILTVNTMSGKLVMKDVVKVAGEYDEEAARELADLILKHHGVLSKLKDAIEESPSLRKWAEDPYKTTGGLGRKTSNKDLFDIACKLEGLPRNFSVHASAMAISYGSLDEICPIQITENKETKEAELVSGYDMYSMQELTVKVDVLGLKTISVISDVCKQVGIDIEKVDLSNPAIYEPLQELKTPHGIFQIEAETQYQACRKVKPNCLAEVSDLMALARPGALAYIGDYADYKTGAKYVKPNHPELDRILASTQNVPLYQEQMMQIGHLVFGLSLDETELLRRVVGKKKTEEMAEWREKVYAAAKEKGLSEELAGVYWKILDDSKYYSFNKCLMPDTIVETRGGNRCLFEIKSGDEVLAYDVERDKNHYVEVVDIHESSAELQEVEFEDGRKIQCSLDHKFLCSDKKMRSLKRVLEEDWEIVCKE